jgi:anti-sigma factor RsiW
MTTATCETIRRHLEAHVDGEETPLGVAAVSAHLATCPGCAAAEAELCNYRTAVARVHRPEPAPLSLVRSLQRLARQRRTAPWQGAVAATGVAFGVAALAALAVAAWLGGAEPTTPLLAEMTTRQHEAVASARVPLEIVTTDPARLVAWFAARLPFEVALPRLDSPELHLMGGRLTEVAGGLAAHVLYRRGSALVSLGVAPAAAGGPPPGAETEAFRSLRFHMSRLGGHNVIAWTDGGLAYALVSDLPAQGRGSCVVCHAPGSGLRGVEGFHR